MAGRLIGGIIVLMLTASTAPAQQTGAEPRNPHPGMGAGHGMAMMMSDALNRRLDSLVTRMNGATGSRKVDAMAAVITELVTQRKMMMEHMHAQMMSGGTMPMMGDSVPPGPRPAGKADTAVDTTDHAAHHPSQ